MKRRTVDREIRIGVAHEAGTELGHPDVLGRRELLADAADRPRRGGVFVSRVALDHRDGAVEIVARHQEIGDETLVPWYQELYYQVIVAARRVKDPYTGAALYFTPHCFRHSFATALAPLIGGDAKTGAKILGHSPQTFMRYVRANDETARAAVERMAEGLSPLGQPLSAPTGEVALRVIRRRRSS